MTNERPRIGRYKVLRELGSGGFGSVYLAEDPRLDALVAIKVLRDPSADPQMRRRFLEEARLMRRLASPGSVVIYDVDELPGIDGQPGYPYFVMEYFELGTLEDRLRSLGRALTIAEGVALASGMASCTSGIHRAQAVHRDLKPSNYLIRHVDVSTVSGEGHLLLTGEELVVADLGLARLVDLDATGKTVALGTPMYMAPEQFAQDPSVDLRADIYAVSAILVGAISGMPPHIFGANGRELNRDALLRTGALAGQLQRGLATDRRHRHESLEAWARSLQDAATGTSGQTPAWPPPSSPDPQPPDPRTPVPPAISGSRPPSSAPKVPPAGAPSQGTSPPAPTFPAASPQSRAGGGASNRSGGRSAGRLVLLAAGLVVAALVGQQATGWLAGGEAEGGVQDQASGRVDAGSAAAQVDPTDLSPIGLEELETTDEEGFIRFQRFGTDPIEMNGDVYDHVVSVNFCNEDQKGKHSLGFAVPDGYQSFSAVFGVSDLAPSSSYAVLEALVDGKRVALVDAEVARVSEVEFNIEPGSSEIRFDFYPDPEGPCDPGPALGRPAFSSARVQTPSQPAESGGATYLDELNTIGDRWDPGSFGTTRYKDAFYQRSMSQKDCYSRDLFEYEFDLGRDFSSLSTAVGFTDRTIERSSDRWSSRVTFSTDGNVLETVEVAMGEEPVGVEIDLLGALRLGVVIETLEGGRCGLVEDKELVGVALLSARLFQDQGSVATPEPVENSAVLLEDLDLVGGFVWGDLKGTIPINGTEFLDSFTYCSHTSSDPNEIEYNLGRDYSTFRTTVGMADTTPDDWLGRFEFFVDGELAWSGESGVGEATSVEIPIDGALRLKIVMTPLSGSGCSTRPPMGLALGSPRVL